MIRRNYLIQLLYISIWHVPFIVFGKNSTNFLPIAMLLLMISILTPYINANTRSMKTTFFILLLTLFGLLTKSFYLLSYIILIAACDIRFTKDLYKSYLVYTFLYILLYLVMWLFGLRVDQFHERDGFIRFSFGMLNPNMYSVCIISLVLCFFAYRSEETTMKEKCVMLLILLVTYFLTQTRTILVVVIPLILNLLEKYNRTSFKFRNMYKTLSMLCIVFAIILPIFFYQNEALNQFFSTRLVLMHQFIKDNGIKIVRFNLNGENNVLDNGIVYVLIRYGVLFFGLIVFLLIKLFNSLKEKKKYNLMLITMIMIFVNALEQVFFSPFNIVLLIIVENLVFDKENIQKDEL